eukprot:Platyproteum_vivax@DN7459_c0_g1_i6.p1
MIQLNRPVCTGLYFPISCETFLIEYDAICIYYSQHIHQRRIAVTLRELASQFLPSRLPSSLLCWREEDNEEKPHDLVDMDEAHLGAAMLRFGLNFEGVPVHTL